jgi:photosystem II stability/assembly factor-like uncharacterized protein
VYPVNNQIIYAGSYVSGVYKSFNQGDTWYQKNSGLGNLRIYSLAIHPTNANILYAGTSGGGVYKSTNGADSWYPVNSAGQNTHTVYDIEIDTKNPNTVYTASRNGNSSTPLRGTIYKSSDAGLTWSLIVTGRSGSLFSEDDYFYEIDVNPLNSNELYLAAHQHGFYKSTNAGQSFVKIDNGVNDKSARTFAIDASIPGLIYGGVWHDDAVYRSDSSGAAWTKKRSGLPVNAAIYRLYLDPISSGPKRIYACTFGNGLYATDNRAESWFSLGLGGKQLYDCVVARGNPNRIFAATHNLGVFRRDLNSSNWGSVMGDLRLNAVTAFASDELSGQVYAAVYGHGVFAVDQTGLIWEDISENLTDKAVLDLTVQDGELHLLTLTAEYRFDGLEWQAENLPFVQSAKEETEMGLLSEKIGVSDEMLELEVEVSYDSEKTNRIESESNLIPLRLVDTSAKQYLGTQGGGLYMRVGKDWEQIAFDGKSVIDFVADDNADSGFAVVCESDSDCSVFKLAGADWEEMRKGIEEVSVNKILLNDEGLLAATDSGIFRFDSNTNQWQGLAGFGKTFLTITEGPGCLLAAAGEDVLAYSDDCGLNWNLIEIESRNYQAISFMNENPRLLLLGSRENGAEVFSLP